MAGLHPVPSGLTKKLTGPNQAQARSRPKVPIFFSFTGLLHRPTVTGTQPPYGARLQYSTVDDCSTLRYPVLVPAPVAALRLRLIDLVLSLHRSTVIFQGHTIRLALLSESYTHVVFQLPNSGFEPHRPTDRLALPGQP